MEKRGWRRGDGDAVMGTWGWGCGAGDVGTGDSGDGVAGWMQHRVAPLHPAALGPTHPSLLLLPALLRLNPRLLLPAGTGAQCRLRLHLRVPGTAQGAHGDGGHPRAPGSGPRAEPSHRCSSMRCSFSLQRRSRSAASLRSSSMRSLSHLLRSSSARRRSSSFRCSSSRCTAGTQRDGTPQPPSAPTHTPSPPPAPRRSPVWCGGSPAPGWSYGSWCPAEQRGSGRAAAPAGTPAPSRFPAPLTTNSSLSVGGVLLVLGAAAGASCASARLSPSCVTSSARRALSTAVASWQRDGDGVGPTAP